MKRKKRAAGRLLFIALIASVIVQGCGSRVTYTLDGEPDASSLSEAAASEEAAAGSGETETGESEVLPAETEPATLWVYVCGAVESPGVYELPEGSRVFAAIEAAGGLCEEAEDRSLNQAALLTDGEQITVLTKEEAENGAAVGGEGAGTAGQSGKVNLNTASKEQLMTLSGIGEARAAAIIAHRETKGPFSAIEEIMQVEGIKEKGFEKIKENIEV